MAILQIPLSQNAPWYDFTTTLSGIRYGIEVRYNDRSRRWYLSINDGVSEPIITGIPMLTDRALLEQYRTYPVPPGEMFVADTTGRGEPATLGSFGTTHQLLYLEPTA